MFLAPSLPKKKKEWGGTEEETEREGEMGIGEKERPLAQLK